MFMVISEKNSERGVFVLSKVNIEKTNSYSQLFFLYCTLLQLTLLVNAVIENGPFAHWGKAGNTCHVYNSSAPLDQ